MAEEILTHTHEVIDTDPRFTIDPKTKRITAGTGYLTLAQHAKNSERLTFYIPEKVIEGHDMTLCNHVRIHFTNIADDLQHRSSGIYKVTDLNTEGEAVTLSWLVDDDATRYAGALIFSIHFACIDDSGEVVYDFPTLTFHELTVGATVWNGDTIPEQYPDIIADFEARISALEAGAGVSAEQIQAAVNKYLDEHPPTSLRTFSSILVAQHSDGSVTMQNTFTDGTSETIVIGSGDTPSISYNGVEIPVEWVVSQ